MVNSIAMFLRNVGLRRKVAVTLLLISIYRMGFWLPLPIVNQEGLEQVVKKMQTGAAGAFAQLLQTASLFSASQVGYSTIFGLGIMPYISCSIVFQLLATVYPPLEKLQKEGDSGRRKINELTRQFTVVVGFVQSAFWVKTMSTALSFGGGVVLVEYSGVYFQFISAVTMTAGTMFLVWVGEQIDSFGLGNGISLLIMAGILAQLPSAVFGLVSPFLLAGLSIGDSSGIDRLLMLFGLFVLIVVSVVCVTQAQRRIQIQTAKHIRSTVEYGVGGQYLPLKLNQSGVMPIIFASSLLMVPGYLYRQVIESRLPLSINQLILQPCVYYLAYAVLIFFFSYFWAAVTFNPAEIAVNLKDNGSFVLGYRPGDRTRRYLEQVIVRVTFVGACFLSLIAILPSTVSSFVNLDPVLAGFYGGSGLLIVVAVSIDVIGKFDSYLVAAQ